MWHVRRLTDLGLLTLNIETSLVEALFWARHLRERWREAVWIESPPHDATTHHAEDVIRRRLARAAK